MIMSLYQRAYNIKDKAHICYKKGHIIKCHVFPLHDIIYARKAAVKPFHALST